jgi:hypothetical protein
VTYIGRDPATSVGQAALRDVSARAEHALAARPPPAREIVRILTVFAAPSSAAEAQAVGPRIPIFAPSYTTCHGRQIML